MKNTFPQILSIRVGKTSEEGELIERKPVTRTKFRQAALLLGGVCVSCVKNKLPLGRTETHVPSRPGAVYRFHEDARSICISKAVYTCRQTQSGFSRSVLCRSVEAVNEGDCCIFAYANGHQTLLALSC